jgi:sec-independent protein translocase protein TatA
MGLSNPLHIAVLGLIILLIFGARRLPELGRSLGSGIKEFKGSLESSSPEAPAPALEPPAPVGDRH